MAQFLVPGRSALTRREGTLEEILPLGHLVRFVWRILESFEFSAMEKLYASVEGGPGRPPYHPRVLAALWIYAQTQGLETAAQIARACTNCDDFRWLAGGLTPCDQTLLNFVAVAEETLPSIWVQVLKAMHQAGHIDLSVLAEDGTKLRANVSPRSFHTAQEIEAVVQDLKAQLARKLEELVLPEAHQRHQARIRILKDRLQRAEGADQQLQERLAGPSQKEDPACQRTGAGEAGAAPRQRRPPEKFSREDFHYDAKREAMICPQGEELRLVGIYPTSHGQGSYRLYKRRDCGDCPLKSRCTQGDGRVLKIPVRPSSESHAASAPAPGTGIGESPQPDSALEAVSENAQKEGEPSRASLTDPQARLMLGGGSMKRIEPSYNADITVTRHQIIVSQFLTNEPNDFNHLSRALPAVVSNLGLPDAWIGDGQYGTHANLVLANHAGVPLYAPMQSLDRSETGKFTAADFRHDPQRDVLICPAGKDLAMVGSYGAETGRPFDLYGRRDCADCALKSKCTTGRGRRVKRHIGHHLLEALEARMNESGEKTKRFRGQTVEPVNGQLKRHGLDRFHVRGLARCGAVLTLACIAHNLMKWKAREAAQALKHAS